MLLRRETILRNKVIYATQKVPDFKKVRHKSIAYSVLVFGLFQISSSCNTTEFGDANFTYNAFPDIIKTKSGKLLCVFYNGWEHESSPDKARTGRSKGGRIMMSVSENDGKTWRPSQVVLDTPFDDRDPSIVQLPNGKIICSFFIYKRRSTHVFTAVYLIESTDEGQTWSAPRLVLRGHANSSPIRVSKEGVLLLSSYSIQGGCFVSKSFDNGLTWTHPITLSPPHFLDLSEPDIVQTDGKLIAIMRSDFKNLHCSESYDGGDNWSIPHDLGFPGAAPYLFNHDNLVLILGHRIPTTSLKVSSTTNVKWSDNIIVDENLSANGAYPSIASIGENELIISYYSEAVKDYESSIFFRKLIFKQASRQITVSDVLSKIDFRESKSN